MEEWILFDFCRCLHFYLYQSQIFIVFVVYVCIVTSIILFILFHFLPQNDKEREGKKGLWLLPLPLMLLMPLPSIYLQA